ncbi:MAG: MerR family DNA-binding protein [Verrucomicrobiales bacterium]
MIERSFYKREGLLAEPLRTDSGYRDYPKNAATRLRFICEAKVIGSTLRKTRSLIGLDIEEPQSCVSVQTIVEAKLVDIGTKLKTMRRMKKILQQLHARGSASAPEVRCPVLEILDLPI